MPTRSKYYMILKADGSTPRVVQRMRSLGSDEVAIPVVVTWPDGWGCVVRDQIDINMPEPPSFEPVGDPIVVGEDDEEGDVH